MANVTVDSESADSLRDDLSAELKTRLNARRDALHWAIRDTRDRRTPEEALDVARKYEEYLLGPLDGGIG